MGPSSDGSDGQTPIVPCQLRAQEKGRYRCSADDPTPPAAEKMSVTV